MMSNEHLDESPSSTDVANIFESLLSKELENVIDKLISREAFEKIIDTIITREVSKIVKIQDDFEESTRGSLQNIRNQIDTIYSTINFNNPPSNTAPQTKPDGVVPLHPDQTTRDTIYSTPAKDNKSDKMFPFEISSPFDLTTVMAQVDGANDTTLSELSNTHASGPSSYIALPFP